MPKPCEIRSKSRWKTIFCPQLRNTRTAAGLIAQTIRNTSQKTAERHLRNASKSQQDRYRNHAEYDRKADGKQSFVRSCETLEQQQDCPNHTKHKPEKCRTLPKERIKKLEGLMPKPCEIRSKSRWKTMTSRNAVPKHSEQQQD